MATKRFIHSDPDLNQQPEKRTKTRPSLASVIGEVVVLNSLQHVCSAIEPLIRKVVNEELDRGLRKISRSFTRSPSVKVQQLQPSKLQLMFNKNLSLPIFTGSKVVDVENSTLHIILVDQRDGQMVPVTLPYAIKVEIVVLHGDFPAGNGDSWGSEEFDRNVVKERTGKRPLLAGDLKVAMRDGFASIGEIEFTDNSSWIRSRKFRIGARVVQGSYQGVRIREVMTESFVVKDHRGELYKKHYPPMLDDEVWRLEKIGKDGAFHKKLASAKINTVQDFVKLSIVDQSKLRGILGPGMSEKMWEVTIKHARTCDLGSKLFIFRGLNYIILLNPICEVVRAVINGRIYLVRDLANINRAYIDNLIKQAYANWNTLEQVDGVLNETALLTQGDLVDQCPNQQQNQDKSVQQNGYQDEHSFEVDCYIPVYTEPGCSNLHVGSYITHR